MDPEMVPFLEGLKCWKCTRTKTNVRFMYCPECQKVVRATKALLGKHTFGPHPDSKVPSYEDSHLKET